MPADGVGWKRLGKLCLSLGLLGWLLWIVEVGEIARVLGRARPSWLLAALALFLGGQVLSAIKWRVLARAVGFSRPLGDFVAYYFVGMFFNAFGLGTVGGDVMRALYLAGGERRGLALNTVLADRASGLLVLLALALASLLVLRSYELPAALYWTTLFLGAGLLTGWWLAPLLVPRLLPLENRLRRLVEEDLAPYWRDYLLLARISLLSLAFHVSQIGVLTLIALALGFEVPYGYFFIVGPLVNIFSALPISWNGLGIREGGYVFFLSHIGLAREASVAFGLVWLGIVLAAAGVGGVVYVALGERRAPRPGEEQQTTDAPGRLRVKS